MARAEAGRASMGYREVYDRWRRVVVYRPIEDASVVGEIERVLAGR